MATKDSQGHQLKSVARDTQFKRVQKTCIPDATKYHQPQKACQQNKPKTYSRTTKASTVIHHSKKKAKTQAIARSLDPWSHGEHKSNSQITPEFCVQKNIICVSLARDNRFRKIGLKLISDKYFSCSWSEYEGGVATDKHWQVLWRAVLRAVEPTLFKKCSSPPMFLTSGELCLTPGDPGKAKGFPPHPR